MRNIIIAFALIAITVNGQKFLDFVKLVEQPALAKFDCLQGLKDDANFMNTLMKKYNAQGPASIVSFLPFLNSWTSQAKSHLNECLANKDVFKGLVQLATQNQTICQDQIRLLADKINVVVKALKSGNMTYAAQHMTEAAQAFLEVVKTCTGTSIDVIPFNVTVCIDETKEFLINASSVYAEYKNGTIGLHDLLNATEDLLRDLPSVVNSCGGNDTEKFLEDKMKGVVSQNCQADISAALQLIESIVHDGIPTNPLDIIGDLGKVRQIIASMSKDCLSFNGSNSTISLVEEFNSKLNSRILSNVEIKREAIKLMEKLVSAHPDATIFAVQRLSLKPTTAPAPVSDCKAAAEKFLDLGKKFVNDFESSSDVSMMADLAELFPLLKDLISACV